MRSNQRVKGISSMIGLSMSSENRMKGGDVKMRKSVMVILILVAVAAMSAGTIYGGTGERGGRGGHRFEGLTEEQRTEVHELVSGMREAGASREEIHAAVAELFENWGIEMPERPEGEGRGKGRGEGRGERRGPGHRLMELLTAEQREAVHALVTEMRETGASREEIHAAVSEMLAGWGIEMPERPEGEGRGEGRGRRRHHALMEKLTEEQRTELHALVTEMREAGSSREEIRAAVHALLESWGIEPPEGCKGENGEMESLISPAEGESATWGRIKGDFR
jgi:DNA-binding transcriptional regulator YhcF (GntR family)